MGFWYMLVAILSLLLFILHFDKYVRFKQRKYLLFTTLFFTIDLVMIYILINGVPYFE